MKYIAIVHGKERELEVTRHDGGLYRVVVEGESYDIDARVCAPGLLSILVDNTSHDISFSHGDSHVQLTFRNNHFDIEVLENRSLQVPLIRPELEISGPEIIKASMPGKVVKVLVAKGQTVMSGAGIVIIEAMKMENEIRCRSGGLVKAVHISAGELVEGDAVLVEIDPATFRE